MIFASIISNYKEKKTEAEEREETRRLVLANLMIGQTCDSLTVKVKC